MPNVDMGEACSIAESAIVGERHLGTGGPTELGANATVRAGSVIYSDVRVGDDFSTGHHALVRSGTVAGDDVAVGTNAVVDGQATLGSHVSLQTGAYVPQGTTIGDEVFFGPHAVITNDEYPVRAESRIEETTIEDHVSIGANATVLPGVSIGRGSFVAAGAVVTEDVPRESLAVGVPAEIRPLPPELGGGNRIA